MKSIPLLALLLLLAGTLLVASPVQAQRLAIDHGVRAAGLWCFPILDKPQQWLYLPATAGLAKNEAGQPRFSLVRYVFNAEADTESASTIQEAAGGGVLHFLVTYETEPAAVKAAERELRRRLDDDEISLRGPVIFKEGRYGLVSSILSTEGKPERKLLAEGRAPVMEGNTVALSFDLEPKEANLLLESLQTATPDVSLVFDMTFSGIVDAYDAQLHVDWSKVHESMTAEAGGSAYWISAEVKTQIDKLIRESSIKLVSRGSDASMEALIAQVYERILSLLFDEVEPSRVPKEERGDLMDALATLLEPGGLLDSGTTTGFGAHVGFQYKNMRSTGTSVLDFNHASAVDRHHYLTFNVGDLYQKYGEDERYFRSTSIVDPMFDQRVVHVAIDGSVLGEFDRLINSVTVTLRKQHEDGSTTLQEVVLDHVSTTPDRLETLSMTYGWANDDDRLAWLRYDYRTLWSFKGGGEYRTDWQSSEGALINLFAPFHRRTIQIVDSGAMSAEVRAIVVAIEYPFFGQTRREQLVVRSNRPLDEQSLEITLPLDEFAYDYSLTWLFNDGGRTQTSSRDASGIIFLDPPPAGASGTSQGR